MSFNASDVIIIIIIRRQNSIREMETRKAVLCCTKKRKKRIITSDTGMRLCVRICVRVCVCVTCFQYIQIHRETYFICVFYGCEVRFWCATTRIWVLSVFDCVCSVLRAQHSHSMSYCIHIADQSY